LSFDFGPQACLFFSTSLSLGFGFAARILFEATTRGLFRQSLRLFSGPDTSVFASLHALDLFCYRPESHLRAAAQLIFLGSLPGFCFQIVPFFLRAAAGLFFFNLMKCGQFTFVRFTRSAQMSIDFSAASFLHRMHSLQFALRPGQFLFGDLTAMFFFGLCASFDFDPLFFLLGSIARRLFFDLAPAFLFGSQRALH
jgi:hypothetical protein